MQTAVFIKGLRIFAHHGVMPQENVIGAVFTLDVKIATDFTRAMKTDDLEGTISYADVVDIIKAEMAVDSKLLEHVAGRIVDRIFLTFPSASHIDLSLMKENPPMGADCTGAGVEISVSRQTSLREGSNRSSSF